MKKKISTYFAFFFFLKKKVSRAFLHVDVTNPSRHMNTSPDSSGLPVTHELCWCIVIYNGHPYQFSIRFQPISVHACLLSLPTRPQRISKYKSVLFLKSNPKLQHLAGKKLPLFPSRTEWWWWSILRFELQSHQKSFRPRYPCTSILIQPVSDTFWDFD